MIDELLLETEGVRAGIVVTPEEVDTGIKAIAGLTRITSAEVIEGAERRGITEKAYREEIRRQVLEGKLMRPQFPHLAAYPTAEEAMGASDRKRDEWLRSLRKAVYLDVRLWKVRF